jgi:hypothetical protein
MEGEKTMHKPQDVEHLSELPAEEAAVELTGNAEEA